MFPARELTQPLLQKVVNMWKGLDEKIVGYLKNVTLDELVDNGGMYDFVI